MVTRVFRASPQRQTEVWTNDRRHGPDGPRGPIARAAMTVGVACILVLSLPAPGAMAAEVTTTYTTDEFYGVSASVSMGVGYDPEALLVKPGSETTIDFSPAPRQMALHVNILRLLEASNLFLHADITDAVNDSASFVGISDPWNVTINITDTPIGTEVVQSVEVFAQSGVTVYVDVALKGQVNGTLSTNSGTLNRTELTWLRWGGQNVTFTAPDESSVSTISASFAYYASSEFLVRFSILGVTDLLEAFGYPISFPLAEFPLGEAPFAKSANIRIETVDVEALIAARTQAEAALEAEQARSLSLSAEITATRAELNSTSAGWNDTNATLLQAEAALAADQAQSLALSAELTATKQDLNSTREEWDLTNDTLTQTQNELAGENTVATGSVGFPIVLIAAAAGFGGGLAAGWIVLRRKHIP